MRISLVGYGKMGKVIEAEAEKRGHEIAQRLDRTWMTLGLAPTEAYIEFTHPESVLGNLRQLIPLKVPIVVGTTGWYQELSTIEKLAEAHGTPVLYASNFSIGVNMLFHLNQLLAKMMNHYPEYDPAIEERHHRHKADAPSGTALTLAKQIQDTLDRKQSLMPQDAATQRPPRPEELSIGVIRSGEIPGTHTVLYSSRVDTLEIRHTAHSREGFALGAVIAAEWLQGKPGGLYHFADVFAQQANG